MSARSQSYLAAPATVIGGELRVPGDKSISHRALLLGAIATGTSHIGGFLRGEDCLATLSALRLLGVTVHEHDGGMIEVVGVGSKGMRSPATAIDLGNSGTAIRLLAGLLAGQGVQASLTGDASLRSRPMARVADPLQLMGAIVETEAGKPPMTIGGGASLHGIDYSMPVASAQVKSALLLAGLEAEGITTVRAPGVSRDHTERMLQTMGVPLKISDDGLCVSVEGGARLHAADIAVPGDFSSAAFFIVAGCLAAREGLLIRNVGINPTRTGLLDIVTAMGGQVEIRNRRQEGSEPVADLFVRQSPLQGIDIPAELVPLAIDEFPVLFVAAAAAGGRTRIVGAEELRHKESDRIAVMAEALRTLGANVHERPDGVDIEGGRLRGGRVDSGGDHRVAMSMAVASLISEAPIEILDTAPVATSFPGFGELVSQIGFNVSIRDGVAA